MRRERLQEGTEVFADFLELLVGSGAAMSGKGVVPDAKEAFRWYYNSAEMGDAESQYRVGNSYHLGRGVEKDLAAAVEWWRKAAEQGHAKAGHNLGTAYYRGDGVPMDKEEAAKWLQK